MKVLLTGANGQLGRELATLLPEIGHDLKALSRAELDVSDFDAVAEAVETNAPDLVVNAAAFTDVDGCETELETAYAVNALGPRNLAVCCERRGCALLHVSTNYVFDGGSERPYEPFDRPNPISAYGRTKLAGEAYVRDLSSHWYLVRTAGVYGEGRNFVRTMLRVGAERDVLNVKDDEYVSPTYARDLAAGIAGLVGSERYGIYHLTNAGACSWYEFAREILALAGADVEVLPVPSAEYPLPATRPANGVMSTLGSPGLRHWRQALEEYLEREGVLRGTAARP